MSHAVPEPIAEALSSAVTSTNKPGINGANIRIVATRGDDFLEDVPLDQLPALLEDKETFIWFDAWGSENPVAEKIAKDVFKFHPLALTDCFGVREHPRIEVFDKYLFVIAHGISAGSTAVATETVELDAFLGPRYLYTYHERHSRSIAFGLELVQRNHGGPLRRGPAVMLHTILDRQVDTMEPLRDDVEERIQAVEDRILIRPVADDLTALLALKRTSLQLRRWMTKQREVMLRLGRNEFALIPASDAVLFRDIYDHLFRMTDLVETHREMLTSLHETYLSVTNLRLGEIMKFLTLFTAILMPLTVITGIYGMNFDNMPELRQSWGYYACLGFMATVGGSIFYYFRRKGWIGRRP